MLNSRRQTPHLTRFPCRGGPIPGQYPNLRKRRRPRRRLNGYQKWYYRQPNNAVCPYYCMFLTPP